MADSTMTVSKSRGHAGAGGGGIGKLVRVAATGGLPLILTIFFASLIPDIAHNHTLRWAIPWVPSLGINLSFFVDGFSLLFALLISGIGTIIMVYSTVYMEHYTQTVRFFIVLNLFMLAMLGIVLGDNMITLFVAWELTTVTSYLLIGFTHEYKSSRDAALQALLVTGIGGLCMLAGLILLGLAAGSFELSEIRAGAVDVREHAFYLPILILILLGTFTKSAQFPFHFWLPNAMAAPTPVSAYLHSATMVKAGVYLMARLYPTLGGTDAWMWTLVIVGGITAVMSSIWSLRMTDLKQVLAYTTVMGLGTLTLFLGAGGDMAIAGAVIFLLVHCLYKATLFLVVGAIDHAVHTRERDQLSGLGGKMPITFMTALGAGLSMAGIPLFIGFLGKETMYEGALHAGIAPGLILAFAVAANALMIAAAGIVAMKPFIGPERKWKHAPHDPPVAMWSGPFVLAALGFVLGIVPGLAAHSLIEPAVSAVAGRPVHLHLALWHGLTWPLALSVLTFALGVACYYFRETMRAWLTRIQERLFVTSEGTYDLALAGLRGLAARQTIILQHGRLRLYLLTIFCTLIGLIGFAFLHGDVVPKPIPLGQTPPWAWPAGLLIIAGSTATILTDSRLTAICALGGVGIGTAILFVSHGAVDVALTQLLVDILFIVLLAVALLKLPPFEVRQRMVTGATVGNAVVAVGVGGLMTLILMTIVGDPLDLRITEYFEANSLVAAHGRNIVNVILVDFRALDTMGEIAVVALAGLSAYALIKLRPRSHPPGDHAPMTDTTGKMEGGA